MLGNRFKTWRTTRRRNRALLLASAKEPPRPAHVMAAARSFPEAPRILILKLDYIGDLVLALPPIAQLRRTWSQASITLLCGPWNVGLASEARLFDRIVPYAFFPEDPSKVWDDHALDYESFATVDLGGPFDLALDLRYYGETRPLLALVDARFRVGYAAPSLTVPLDIELPLAETFSKRAAPHEPLHDQVRMTLLVAAASSVLAPPRSSPLKHATDTMAPDRSAIPPRSILIAPGAGYSAKTWPIENFAALCAKLATTSDCDFVLIGHSRDTDSINVLTAALPPGRARVLVAGPLEQLPSLLSGAALCIGNDSAPTHMSAQLGVPTICIFGGTNDFRIWQPVGPKVRLVRTPIGCSPCYLHRREDCPIGLKCLASITVDEVAGVGLDMLAAGRS